MTKDAFVKLLLLLSTKGRFRDGREITAGEMLFVFIHILKANSVKDTAHRFQHSKASIHDVLYDTIHSMLLCKKELIRQPQAVDPVRDMIRLNPKFFPFFEHAIGALDGSHVPAVVGADMMDVCRNRKGWCSQNVLGVCDFDMHDFYLCSCRAEGWYCLPRACGMHMS